MPGHWSPAGDPFGGTVGHRAALLVGGTGDRSWEGFVARRLIPHVLEVEQAGHALTVPGPMARPAEVLGRVRTGTEVEEFVRVTSGRRR
ncbi:hypothetical protein AB0L34_21220 [Micromonospora sp. NPDC052213]|uniref:hypothetical protein n=1 Tax=Micromonospora sp. NPDC052213 TaxID=3155812 RepID=UPI00342FF1EB